MLSRLADRLIMLPTRHAIETENRVRRVVESSVGQFEVWQQRTGLAEQADMFVLKFAGTGGRAERPTDHPAEFWHDTSVEVWAVNPPGYGGSPGRASLQNIQAVARAAFREIQRTADGRPIVVAGSSLGTLSALHLSAREMFAGMIVRNPPPLREVIVTRFGWFTLGTSTWIANQVPDELCAIENASRSSIPTVFISSRKDRVVPTHLQDRVYDAYAGEHRIVHLADANHADLMNEEEADEYFRHLGWLRERMDPKLLRSSVSPSSP